MNKTIATSVALTVATMALNASNPNPRITYPVAPHDNTIDTYFGKTVADPYRPLENDTAAATLQWVKAENAITRGYLDAIPFRDRIHTRLTELNNYVKTGMPSKEPDGRYYFYENDGLKNQSVLYRSNRPDGSRQLFLDPNTLSTDGTVALTGVFMSPDGKYTAYTISRSGSDWAEIYVMDTETGKLLDDHIVWAKFTTAEWSGDGFYYDAYDAPVAGKEFSNANEYQKVYYHKIGTPQSADTVAFQDLNAPLHFHRAWVPDNGRVLGITVSGQGNGNGLLVKRLDVPDAKWVTIEPSQVYEMAPIDVQDNNLLIYTSKDAPNYRVVSIPLDNLSWDNATDLVPQTGDVLTGISLAGKNIIAVYDRDASTHAVLLDANGKKIRDIELPGFGTAAFSSSKKSDEVFYTFASFTSPSSVYSYDIATGKSKLMHTPVIKNFDMNDYVTEQVFYPSKDGTKIPMFITYKKGVKRDGTNPVYLYGYGGFNITLNPGFSANRVLWLENGGIYAQANLRGGGEYGEPWHIAGTLQQKQNVFDDFIAAGEYMVSQGWTKPELLTIEGGSNGGLLVGACANQRPDLFRVAIPRVGVMDMMRYHLFTIGWNWAHDYGTSADSPQMAEYLLAYSPLHNIKNDGTPYPAIMVTTADHDDRVVPAHSFKYAATLQAANTGDRPKLIRIDSKAGHGAGKPISKTIDEWTDIYSFVLYNLGLEPKAE